jgi:hypothetical protein
MPRRFFPLSVLALLFFLFARSLFAGTLTVETNSSGPTPDLIAYNSGHFYPGSNTKDWWRYSGVTGARVFLTASLIEPDVDTGADDIAGRGDGVTDQTSFLSRKTALRANPLSSSYVNWTTFTNGYNTSAKHGANRLQPTLVFTELRKYGVQIDVNIGASQNYFYITNSADWAGKWELWQHFYAQAFYLGRAFDVQRFQMFNEPDHPNAGGLTQSDYLQRLQLCSDAIQCALADVNTIYGKSLVPKILAPVITTSSYGSWAQLVVNNRHVNFLGQTDTNFFLLHKYDYHQYNSTPASFGSSLAALQNSMASAMSPEPRFPTTISEFNVHTAAVFDGLADTLDSPSNYTRLGAIGVNLAKNFQSELYCFKLSQTDGDVGDNYPVRKNGMHYVDNDSSPYNIGGITKAAEVWRLFNKAFAPGRELRNLTVDSSLANLTLLASYDVSNRCCYIFSANESSSNVTITVDASTLGIQNNNRVFVEEVSETSHGSVTRVGVISNGLATTWTQPALSVWLFTIPGKMQQVISANETLFVTNAVEDVIAKDGLFKNVNFGLLSDLSVRNDPLIADNRSAAFIKARLPLIYLPDVQAAFLSLQASTIASNTTAQAHVYGISSDSWSQNTLNWANGPNLKQNVPAGNRITNNFLNGLGDSAFVAGQIVCTSTAPVEVQIDITRFVLAQTNYDLSFLISQDPRWNVTLPSLAPGDAQPDGIKIISTEGAGALPPPRIKFIRLRDSDSDGISDEAEVNVFLTNPNNPDTDGDGTSDGQEILVFHTNAGTNIVAPSVSTQPASQTVQAGSSATFSVIASGSPSLAYQWRFNSNSISGATNASVTLTDVQQADVGNYSVIVTNSAGSVTSSNAVLAVTNPVVVVSTLPIYEPLAYAPGSALEGQGGWVLSGGTSGTIESGNLAVTGLSSAIGNRVTWGGPSMSLRLPIGTNVTGDIYFSFALRVDDLGNSFTGLGTVAGFTTGTSTSFGAKINIRTNGAGGFNLGVSKGSGTTFGDWATNDFATNEIIFVVGRYTFNSTNSTDDVCALWLNPGSEHFGAPTPPTPAVPNIGVGGADLSQVDRFFFRSGGSSVNPAKIVADELRVGLTWTEVTTPPRPALEILRSGTNAVVFWPTNFSGFALQHTTNLWNANWTSVTNNVVVSGTNNAITSNIAPANKTYFRLRK